MATPVKRSHPSRSQAAERCKLSENFDPNLHSATPRRKPIKSPVIKSSKPKASAPKTPIQTLPSPPTAVKNKSILTQKNPKPEKKNLGTKKCPKSHNPIPEESSKDHQSKGRIAEIADPSEENGSLVMESSPDLDGSSKMRKIKRKMLEKARISIPEPECGRVMHLVQAFERLLSLPRDSKDKGDAESKGKIMAWALPGFDKPPKALASEEEYSSSSIPSGGFCFSPSTVSDNESCLYPPICINDERLSCDSSISDRSRKNRRNSSGSSGRSWNKKLKVTSQQPFKLQTEQRGRLKEEKFLKKVKEILMEEEKQRIPIAQGLPWTTDEPECLVKPCVKESTEPIDLDLHSDVRAVVRAEFDYNIAQRMNFIEQIKLEKERQKKMEEEEEIRRLRKELVLRAQPMPYFDRPFIPKRSRRPKTIPNERKPLALTVNAYEDDGDATKRG